MSTATDHLKEMAKIVRQLAYRHSTHNVFSDFVEMAAISLKYECRVRAPDYSTRAAVMAQHTPPEIQDSDALQRTRPSRFTTAASRPRSPFC